MAIALRYAARSDLGLGPKARNEDSGYAGPNLLVLADGMGGHAAGDVASSMIVGELAPLDAEDVTADQAIGLLEEALRSANAKLTTAMRDNADLTGMGSTTIVMLRTGNKLAMAHIGDSRAFMLRGDTFSQITKDHSFVQQLVDEGRISKEEAGHHPQRSVVTRVMTGQPDDEPDTSLREAKIGDRFLLCSDGLSDFVGADVIEEILREAATPADAAERCIEVALKASTRDNVTVIVADVVDADGDDLPPTVPQVVGAAASRSLRTQTRPIPTSPAAKAAALSREATGRGAAATTLTTRSSSPSRRPARAVRASSDGWREPPSSWPCSPPEGMPPGPGPSASSTSPPRRAASRSSAGCRRTSGRSASRRSRARATSPCPTCPSTCRARSSAPSRRATWPMPRPRCSSCVSRPSAASSWRRPARPAARRPHPPRLRRRPHPTQRPRRRQAPAYRTR